MKKAALTVKGQYILFAACVVLLSSCHVYKPFVTEQNATPNAIMQKISAGKRYAFVVEGDKTVYMRVDSIMADRVKGPARIKSDNATVRSGGHTVYLNTILSAKERKVSAPRTIGFVAGLGLVAFLAVAMLDAKMLAGPD